MFNLYIYLETVKYHHNPPRCRPIINPFYTMSKERYPPWESLNQNPLLGGYEENKSNFFFS
jgi:hypothetical protein